MAALLLVLVLMPRDFASASWLMCGQVVAGARYLPGILPAVVLALDAATQGVLLRYAGMCQWGAGQGSWQVYCIGGCSPAAPTVLTGAVCPGLPLY